MRKISFVLPHPRCENLQATSEVQSNCDELFLLLTTCLVLLSKQLERLEKSANRATEQDAFVSFGFKSLFKRATAKSQMYTACSDPIIIRIIL